MLREQYRWNPRPSGRGACQISGREYAFEAGDAEDAEIARFPPKMARAAARYIPRGVVGGGAFGKLQLCSGERVCAAGGGLERELGSPAEKNRRAKILENSAETWSDPRRMLREIAELAIEPAENDGGSRISPWALRWEKKSALRAEGSLAHSRQLFSIAREYVRVFGRSGKPLFYLALERKRSNSPDLANPSRSTRDRRNPFDERHFGDRAWASALVQPFDDQPIERIKDLAQSENACIRGAARVYSALFLESLRLGVRREWSSNSERTGFGKDSRTLAILLGARRTTVRRWITRAVDLQILSVNPGRKHVKGLRGVSASYRLVTAAMEARQRAEAFAKAAYDDRPATKLLEAALPVVRELRVAG